jgi:predicted permease
VVSLVARLRSRLRGLTHRGRLERELDAELAFHVEAHAEELRRQGLPPAEALRRARLEFGSVESAKEECRRSLGLALWDEIVADLRYGLRQLRHNRTFTAVAVVSIGLGIGANTAIYTLTREVLLKPLAVPRPERLQTFSWVRPKDARSGPVWGSFGRTEQGEMAGTPFPYPLYLAMREQNRAQTQPAFEDLVAFKDVHRLAATFDGVSEAIEGLLVSGNFHSALAPTVAVGRGFVPDDDRPAAEPVAVLSDAYWGERFARSPAVLGRTISIGGTTVTVIGVHGPAFHGLRSGGRPQIFLPIALQPRIAPLEYGSLLENRSFWWVAILGRVSPGVSAEEAHAAIDPSFRAAFHATMPDKRPEDLPRFLLEPGRRGLDHQRSALRQPLAILLALAGVVLLAACVNLANLQLARATARRRELDLRLALGAGRGRVLRQLLTESLLLAGLGGLAGVALGTLGRNALPRLFEDAWTTRGLALSADPEIFAFATALTVLTGLAFGLGPAVRATRAGASPTKLDATHRGHTVRRGGLAKSLVVVQLALCGLLVVGAGLFVRTLMNLHAVDSGLSTTGITLFQLDPPRSRVDGAERLAFYERVEQRLAALPGVEIATLSSEPLLSNSMAIGCLRPASWPTPVESGDEDAVWTNHVGAGFFAAYGLRVPQGRAFAVADSAKASRVAVINQRLATRWFPEGDALGRLLVECDPDADKRPIEVVGVAADARYSSLRDEVPFTVYLPYRQATDLGAVTFVIKNPLALSEIGSSLARAVREVDADVPLIDLRTQEQQVAATLTGERTFAILAGAFGAIALLLAAIGVYGLMAYDVARRTQEIGIRKALGARTGEVVAMILRDAATLAGVGVVIGLGLAIVVMRLLGALLFAVRPTDPLTYGATAVLLAAVALAAGALPAWRAARVDAIESLRHE